MSYNKLTPAEANIIEGKGTEPPGSGEYDDFYRDGVYLCRRCNAPLYRSKDKFDSQCGWPSFDDEIKGAVKRQPDTPASPKTASRGGDGRRTEIICANCGAHLGHVFLSEQLTAKDTRHCVNSLSMRFIPQNFAKSEKPSAILGGGCFWCLDAAYRGIKGITEVITGYAGGSKDRPTYEEVSSGTTGHAEVVKITYDPAIINYRQLLEIFFTIHDPTTINRQGNDIGEQYRSLILYQTWREREEAEKIINELSKEKIFDKPIVTEIKPLIKFYPAEDYHQDYYTKNPDKAYCQVIISAKLGKLREKFKLLIRG